MAVTIAQPGHGRDLAYPLAARTARPEGSVVEIGGVPFGGRELVVIAGPCAVETAEQVHAAAHAVAEAGARVLRGGAFKPRTSPYAFQGLGVEGLHLLAEAGRAAGLPVVTEVLATEDVAVVAEHADALQVGARNVQNFALLKALGRAGRPVLLKRGMSTTIEELLMAAEYVLAHGNPDVILCERGIRSFDPSTRNTLDLAAVPVLAALTHLPVVIDPSHGTGRRDLVAPLSKAAVAAGADGLIIEVHPDPDTAWSDGPQSLEPRMFADLMRELAGYAALEGRALAAPRWRDARPRTWSTPVGAYRDQIDEVDDQILALLEHRAELGQRLGRIKVAAGQPLRVPEREQDVIERAAAAAAGPGGLGPDAVVRVFRAIVSETRAVQEDRLEVHSAGLGVAG